MYSLAEKDRQQHFDDAHRTATIKAHASSRSSICREEKGSGNAQGTGKGKEGTLGYCWFRFWAGAWRCGLREHRDGQSEARTRGGDETSSRFVSCRWWVKGAHGAWLLLLSTPISRRHSGAVLVRSTVLSPIIAVTIYDRESANVSAVCSPLLHF